MYRALGLYNVDTGEVRFAQDVTRFSNAVIDSVKAAIAQKELGPWKLVDTRDSLNAACVVSKPRRIGGLFH